MRSTANRTLIGLVAAMTLLSSSCGRSEEPGIEEAKFDEIRSLPFRVSGEITDYADKQHVFSNLQLDLCRCVPSTLSRGAVTIETDGVFYLYDISKVKRIQRDGRNKVTVSLKDGGEQTGDWVSNDDLQNFYRDSGNPPQPGVLLGICVAKPTKIRIDRVKQVVFTSVEKGSPPKDRRPEWPKRVELTNGLTFNSAEAYVLDFCGHGWSSHSHTRLTNSVRTVSNTVSLANLTGLEFSGKSDGQNREITLTFKDGHQETDLLYLTSESYNGVCNHSARFSGFDKLYLAQPFGAVLVPLDLVKKVVPNPVGKAPKTGAVPPAGHLHLPQTHLPKKVPPIPVRPKASPVPRLGKAALPFVKGVNYVSWTTGDFPWTCSWKRQTYHDSQAIANARITDTKPFEGRGSLELEIQAVSGETHAAGEVYTDLRYLSGYKALRPIKIKRAANGHRLGIDMAGKSLAALVFCENGTGGINSAPNGLQLILKSVRIDDKGNEVWSSYYANWQNIWSRARDRGADKALGNVREGQWSLIALKVPEKDKVAKPLYGQADPGFDPTQIALLGLKFGLNQNVRQARCTGKRIWIDSFGFKDIVCDEDSAIDLSDLPSEWAKKVWQHFGTTPTQLLRLDRGIVSRETLTFRCTGNSAVFDFNQTENPVASLASNGFNFVGIVNTEYMPNPNAVTIEPVDGKSHTLEHVESLVKECHRRHLKVMLKPHVDVVDDSWRGTIQPTDVSRWFANYRRFLLPYAKLAERHKVAMLCIGCEFKSLDSGHREEWEKTIEGIREVYRSGPLTYASNWDAYESVCFWHLLDVCGIDGYFPLCDKKDPSLKDLVSGWSGARFDMAKRQWGGGPVNWIVQLDKWRQKSGKDIVFTEIGYRSTDYAAREPWEYEEARPVNLALQDRCYQAVIESFKDKPWFKGVFFWLWSPSQDTGGAMDTGFTSQHKPAERIFVQR